MAPRWSCKVSLSEKTDACHIIDELLAFKQQKKKAGRQRERERGREEKSTHERRAVQGGRQAGRVGWVRQCEAAKSAKAMGRC